MPTPLNRFTDFIGITRTREKQVEVAARQAFVPEGERVTLFEWTTVTRPQIGALTTPKLNRSFLVIGIFIAGLLLVMQEFFLIAAIGSLVFLWYVLSAAPVEQVTHRISNHGVEYSDQFYGWNELTKYFFSKAGTMETLCVDTKERLPGRIFFMINPGDREKLKEIVGKYLTYLEEEPKTFADKWYEKAVSKISLGDK